MIYEVVISSNFKKQYKKVKKQEKGIKELINTIFNRNKNY